MSRRWIPKRMSFCARRPGLRLILPALSPDVAAKASVPTGPLGAHAVLPADGYDTHRFLPPLWLMLVSHRAIGHGRKPPVGVCSSPADIKFVSAPMRQVPDGSRWCFRETMAAWIRLIYNTANWS